jgi:MFS family permease
MSSPTGPAYRRFVAASGLSNLADGIATLAWTWVASLLTRDALLLAAIPVALRLPWFLAAIPAGLVADRVDRRRLILAMDILRAAAFLGAGLALAQAGPLPPTPTEGPTRPDLFALLALAAATVGTAEVFRDNAAQTMLPALVPHDHLETANGRLWSVEILANQLLGPPLAAWLLGTAAGLPFLANAGLYTLAATLVAAVPGRFHPWNAAIPTSLIEAARDGLRFLLAQPLLRLLALVTGLWNLLHQMTALAFLLYAQEVLHLSARGYGLILAAGALGGLLGGLTAGRIVARLGPARVATWSLALTAPCFASLLLLPGPWTIALTFAAFEFFGILWNTVSVSYRQRLIPDAILGRVNSLYRLLAWGMMPAGLALSGLMIETTATILPRTQALALPIWTAAIAAAALVVATGRPLARGLRAAARHPLS